MPEYRRQGTTIVEEAPKWVEEKYRYSQLALDGAPYDRHILPHGFGRQQ